MDEGEAERVSITTSWSVGPALITRREAMARGAGGLGALALPAGAMARPAVIASTPPVGLFLVDDRLDGIADVAARMAAAGIPVRSFGGDAGEAWLDALEPLWRSVPVPVAGITRGAALFCLERLGRDMGMACAVKRLHPPGRIDALAGDELILRAGRSRSMPAAAPLRARTSDQARGVAVAWLLQPMRLRRA